MQFGITTPPHCAIPNNICGITKALDSRLFSYLVVFLYDKEIVNCFIYCLVVVVLYRSQVWFDQWKLFNLQGIYKMK